MARTGEITRLPPVMLPEFKSRRRRRMWIELFVVCSPPCSETEVFLWVLRFLRHLKTQHFQIPIRQGMVDEEPLCG